MKLLRSWPAEVPDRRNYVVDTLEKLIIADYDYAVLADVEDDVVLIEWDLAVDAEELECFLDVVREDRDRVVVAPYLLYTRTLSHEPLKQTVWAHRRADGTHLDVDEPFCAFFGFGLIYFPRTVVAAFRAAWRGHFSDGSFSGWHFKHVAEQVPVVWGCRPVHLHYRIDRIAAAVAREDIR